MSDEFTFKERPGYYARKRDGFRVKVADWPDGDVSWVLDPMPLIAPRFVGTCSAKSFASAHAPVEENIPEGMSEGPACPICKGAMYRHQERYHVDWRCLKCSIGQSIHQPSAQKKPAAIKPRAS